MLVVNKKENKNYIAKKILLDGLSSKEQEGCMLEVNLLRKYQGKWKQHGIPDQKINCQYFKCLANLKSLTCELTCFIV